MPKPSSQCETKHFFQSLLVSTAQIAFAVNHIHRQEGQMFTIEHDFDVTVITLVDEGDSTAPLQEDLIIEAFEDCVVLRQINPVTDMPVTITLSLAQVQDLAAALDLPEGSYRIAPKP
jgi:hypothetical protein